LSAAYKNDLLISEWLNYFGSVGIKLEKVQQLHFRTS